MPIYGMGSLCLLFEKLANYAVRCIPIIFPRSPLSISLADVSRTPRAAAARAARRAAGAGAGGGRPGPGPAAAPRAGCMAMGHWQLELRMCPDAPWRGATSAIETTSTNQRTPKK